MDELGGIHSMTELVMRNPLFSLLTCSIVTSLLSCSKEEPPAATRPAPSVIAEELYPVMLDLAVLDRARECAELMAASAAFEAGKPYKVAETRPGSDYCKVVSGGKADATQVGGFQLEQFKNCVELSKGFESNVASHGNNLMVKKGLFCGKDGKPSMTTDDSVELTARLRLAEALPLAVKAVGEGKISPEIKACYEETKAHIVKVVEEARRFRCAVMRADEAVAGMTWDAAWTRAHLHEEYAEYQKSNADNYERLVKLDLVSLFFAEFTDDAKTRACAAEASETFSAQRSAARTAAAACM